MSPRRWFIATFLFAFALGGARGSASDFRIDGRVLAPGGRLLQGAQVRVYPALDPNTRARALFAGSQPKATATVSSNADGTFNLRVPRAGLWTVRLEAPGFVPMERRLEPLVESVNLEDVSLQPDAGLTIRITGAGNKPVIGATVRLIDGNRQDPGPFRSTPWRFAAREGLVDAHGALHLPRAIKGSVSLTASAPGYALIERADVGGAALALRLVSGDRRVVEVFTSAGKPAKDVLVAAGRYEHPIGFTDDRGQLVVSISPDGSLPLILLAADGTRGAATITRSPDDRHSSMRINLPERATTVGQVIDMTTRLPLPGAFVWPRDEPWNGVMTREGGGFSLAGSSGRRLDVVAQATGYLRSSPTLLRLSAEDRDGPILALSPAAVVEGTVVNQDGRPLAGAVIRLAIKSATGGRFIYPSGPVTEMTARSDPRGAFRLSSVHPGFDYTLSGVFPGYATTTETVRDLEPRKARTGLRLVLTTGQLVTGRVVDPEDKPLANADVVIRPNESGARYGRWNVPDKARPEGLKGSTDADGRFRMEKVATGSFDLDIRRSGFAALTSPRHEVPTSAEPVDLGKFVLEPGAQIKGRVNDSAGQPIGGVEISLVQGGPFMIGIQFSQDTDPDAVTGSDGRFVLEDLRRGAKVDLAFNRPGYVGRTESGVEIPSSEPLIVTLQAASTVSGKVVGPDGAPIPQAWVSLQRKANMGAWMRSTSSRESTTDATGRFRFDGVEPGSISLAALAGGYRAGRFDDLEVPKGADLDGLSLSLALGAVLTGRVLTSDNLPCIGAWVRTIPDGDLNSESDMDSAQTDGSGSYRLDELAPGSTSIEAHHNEFGRAVGKIEVHPGANTLDLQFEGGQTISGTVIDSTGAPIARASLQLLTINRVAVGPPGESDRDGVFQIKEVKGGDYILWADAEGYAPYRDEATFKVAGEPIAGIQIRLVPGATITGRILGVNPVDYPEIRVQASLQAFQSESAGLDHSGAYRIQDIAAGEYDVTASFDRAGRWSSGRVELKPGIGEAHLDLQFGRGLTLSGRAWLGDLPIRGADISAHDTAWRSHVSGRTDSQGAFRIEGLEAGSYEVQIGQVESGLSWRENIELEGDREVNILVPTARVAGNIVDAATTQPISDARVSLIQAVGDKGSLKSLLGAASDASGRFMAKNIPDGSYRLMVSKDGYASGNTDLVVQNGMDVDGLRIDLVRAEGLILNVRMPAGNAPDEVRVAALDANGQTVMHGSFRAGESGTVLLTSLAAGSWDLIVAASGAATTSLHVDVPGSPIQVTLLPACGMDIEVPALAGTKVVATMTLTDDQGRPFRILNWSGDPLEKFTIDAEGDGFRSLPPETWKVRVSAPDGRTWEGSATTSPGTNVRVLLK